MSKGRTQSSTVWETSNATPVYLDSAYKHLLRQEIKANSLKNRTKVLHICQDHLLKQIENNQNKLSKLDQVKGSHSKQRKRLQKDKQWKNSEMERQKMQNTMRKQNHFRQMSNLILQKQENMSKVKQNALNLRKEHHKLIEANRKAEYQKKKQIRNKIHEDIVQSRATIKNYFNQKHESIVYNTQEEIKKINLKRIKEQQDTKTNTEKQVNTMEEQIKRLRQTLHFNKCTQAGNKQLSQSKVTKHQTADVHPLVKRIESVMSKYTKFL